MELEVPVGSPGVVLEGVCSGSTNFGAISVQGMLVAVQGGTQKES